MKIQRFLELIYKKIPEILFVLAIILGFFGVYVDQELIKLITLIVAGVIISSVAVFKFFRRKYIDKRVMNSTNVFKNAKKHCKKLLGFEKVIRKKLEKNQKIKKYRAERKELNLLYKKIINNQLDELTVSNKIKALN